MRRLQGLHVGLGSRLEVLEGHPVVRLLQAAQQEGERQLVGDVVPGGKRLRWSFVVGRYDDEVFLIVEFSIQCRCIVTGQTKKDFVLYSLCEEICHQVELVLELGRNVVDRKIVKVQPEIIALVLLQDFEETRD